MARGPILATPALTPAIKQVAQELFLEQTRREANGCLTWRGPTVMMSERPVPMWNYNGRNTTAAKWAFELFVRPLKPGELVWRTCGSGLCVEHDHLSAGKKTRPKKPVLVSVPTEKTWSTKRPEAAKRLRKIKASAEMKNNLTLNLTDEVLTWTLSDHAEERMAEFGFLRSEVLLAAAYPEVAYQQPSYVGEIHQRGEIAVAVCPEQKIIKTVLRRQVQRWEHQA